jgi:hypothetical protein
MFCDALGSIVLENVFPANSYKLHLMTVYCASNYGIIVFSVSFVGIFIIFAK